MADVEVDRDSQHVATVTLNRPHVKNALSIETADLLADSLLSLQSDPEVRVIILTGAGKDFCGGGDLKRLAQPRSTLEIHDRLTEHMHRIPYAFESVDKPVIAAVNGDAFGAGMDISLMCDFRFAATSARFSDGYILAGLVPGDGGSYLLPRIVGIATALDLLLTGRTVDSAEALRLGLVNRVIDDGDLLAESGAFAAALAAKPSHLVRAIKRLTYQSARSDLRTSLHLAAAEMGVVRSTTESAETLANFMSGRDQRRPSDS